MLVCMAIDLCAAFSPAAGVNHVLSVAEPDRMQLCPRVWLDYLLVAICILADVGLAYTPAMSLDYTMQTPSHTTFWVSCPLHYSNAFRNAGKAFA